MKILVLLCAVALLAPMCLRADTLTGDKILDGLDVSQKERSKLLAGEVVAFDGEAYENSARDLAADATVLVNKSLDEVLAQIKEIPSIIPQKYVVEYADITSESDFDSVGFEDAEYEHADAFLRAKAGKHYNLSRSELEKLAVHNKAGSRAQRLEAASAAVREILLDRYRSYRASGFDGIGDYQRSRRKAVSIGRDLRLTTETLEPFSGYFPDYYRVLNEFPQGADCCEHIFRWLKVEIRKKPVWALSHTIIQERDDYLLVTERHYYVTSTLNLLQVTLSWVPWDEDTQMGIGITASTDMLDSFMGKMLRPLGRNKARDMVSEIMTDIRDELQDGAAAAP